ncbi:hypothetical protein [Cupriavidus sp. D39]|uniref:hypothetical protein n=1 Tax=Cupriavidus sp. D39 TaxID=2997877 RepID=UPI00226D57EE|nr:hypothetical protein [Cupriavidus sp. D39]MCY0853063.1 hypothetical protein [Cupriavidus sp. D39]
MDGYFIKKIGANKGRPRVWLEGLQAAIAGFGPGQRYDIEVRGRTLVLQANPDGTRVVSAKTIGERINPVIDLNSQALLACFDGMAAVRVVAKQGENGRGRSTFFHWLRSSRSRSGFSDCEQSWRPVNRSRWAASAMGAE